MEQCADLRPNVRESVASEAADQLPQDQAQLITNAPGTPRRLGAVQRAGLGALIGTLVLLLGVASPAKAAGLYEPNDSMWTSTGPIAGGAPIQSSLETDDDVDWFRLNLLGNQQFHVDLTAPSCDDVVGAELLDGDGEAIDHTYINLGYGTTSWGFHRTSPPAGGIYYLRFSQAEGCDYSFAVSPTSAVNVTERPAPPISFETEHNDTAVSASGPLLPHTTYQGSFGTTDDKDWVWFYARPRSLAIFEISAGRECANLSWRMGSARRAANTGMITSDWLRGDHRATYEFPTGRGGRMYANLIGYMGCSWRITAAPDSGVLGEAPAPRPGKGSAAVRYRRCQQARSRLRKARARYRRKRAYLNDAGRRNAYTEVRRARRAVTARCSKAS